MTKETEEDPGLLTDLQRHHLCLHRALNKSVWLYADNKGPSMLIQLQNQYSLLFGGGGGKYNWLCAVWSWKQNIINLNPSIKIAFSALHISKNFQKYKLLADVKKKTQQKKRAYFKLSAPLPQAQRKARRCSALGTLVGLFWCLYLTADRINFS